MIVWIDLGTLGAARPLFGLDPLERFARTLARLDPGPTRIVVSGLTRPERLPEGFDFERGEGKVAARLRAALDTAGDVPILALDAATVVDPRLVRHLAKIEDTRPAMRVALGGEAGERAGLLRLSRPDAKILPDGAEDLTELAERVAVLAPQALVKSDEVPSFIVNLRRNLPFYLFGVRGDAEARRIERRLFVWNYKGSTDFLTKWVYPPLVWRLVKLSTSLSIPANAITILSVVLTFAAVPLFATGHFLAGLVCAFAMSVLDSVDGKVARLTLSDSALGNVLDHGLDIVHPPLWYGAWALGLGAAEAGDPLTVACALLIGFYVADRLVLMVAKARFGRGLHAMGRIDVLARTWIARRNVNLVLMAGGLAIGAPQGAYYLIAAWQGLTFAWHAVRTAWLIRTRAEPMSAIG